MNSMKKLEEFLIRLGYSEDDVENIKKGKNLPISVGDTIYTLRCGEVTPIKIGRIASKLLMLNGVKLVYTSTGGASIDDNIYKTRKEAIDAWVVTQMNKED